MTLLILVLSEIVPKTIGARYWVHLAPFLPTILNGMIFILKPFIWMSDRIMDLFGGHVVEHDIRLEIKALALLGRELDKIDADEQRVISNILDLHEINVRQHLFLIYDEYGGWMGLVTMEDVMEAIIGQSILDETDDIPNMRRHARRRWQNRLKSRTQDNRPL